MHMKHAIVILFCCVELSICAQSLNVEVFQLKNGLTVFLNEDPGASNVFGAVWVKAGGKHDPADATGMAHYLEHMLFKGTETLGTIDFEKERPYLDSIRLYYDRLALAPDDQKLSIQKKINQFELAASEYAVPNEFDRLIKSVGSTNVNASTSFDYTNYRNFFPSNQINRWLDIYAHRFQNPVFRLFQSELETVYEEKNRAGDNLERRVSAKFREYIYGDHPYSTQTVLGSVEHLKNPSLSKMYQYFEDYYVANNMALVLSGNFDSDQVKPQIEKTFGKLRTGKVPEYPKHELSAFNGRTVEKVRITPIKAGFMGYKLVPVTHPDRAGLEVIGEMMSNNNETGFIDKMTLDNEVLYAGGYQEFFQEDGSTFIFFVPKVLGKGLKKFEEKIRNEFVAIANGDFSEEYLNSIKNGLYKSRQWAMEDLDDRAWHIGYSFILGVDWETYQGFTQKINDLSKEQVMELAKRYFQDDFFVMQSRTGFPKKVKLKKPPYQPIARRTDETSAYGERFKAIPELRPEPRFMDFEKDVKVVEDYIYLTKNELNDVFTLQLKIAKGIDQNVNFPLLASALNASGTDRYTAQGIKQQFANLGATYNCYTGLSSFNITINGLDANFEATLDLLIHLLEGFSPTEKTFAYLANQRGTENKVANNNPSSGGGVLYRYGLWGEKAYNVLRPSIKEIKRFSVEKMQQVLQELLADGITSIHYVGNGEQEEITNLFTSSPILKRNTTDQYQFWEAQTVDETTIYLVNDKKAIQSYVYYIVNGEPLNRAEGYKKDAFNAYYTNSLSGLLFQEVREFRSLAYATGGNYIDPIYEPEKRGRLVLFTGSQADKTTDAVGVVLDLIENMPAYEDRLAAIRDGLILSSGAAKPDFRSMSTTLEEHLKTGYQQDPNEIAHGRYPDLQFSDIQSFYESNIKGKPVIVTIYGDVSKMDMNKLRQYGKVVTLKMDDIRVE